MKGKTVLITGGAGFIGSHIVDEFVEKGCSVVIVDNFKTGKRENINPQAKCYDCDITSEELESVFEKERPELVVHLAAQISVAESAKNPLKDAKTNILGSLNILNLSCKYGVKKIIAASSAAVYGDQPVPISENSIKTPMSPYGLSKLTMEKYIELSGLDYIIFRFSNVYGERQTPGGEAGVITIFENAMKNNLPVKIYGSGEQVRDFIYVKDIAKITYELSESEVKNEIINVSTNTGITINQLFKSLAKKYDYKLAPIYECARSGDIDKSILSNEKLLRLCPDLRFSANMNGEVVHA